MTEQEKLEALANFDSFELAKQLGLSIHYFEFSDDIYGYYTRMLNAEKLIINSKLSLEKQEKVCDHLMAHYVLHEGMEFCLDGKMYQALEKNKNTNYIILHRKLALS